MLRAGGMAAHPRLPTSWPAADAGPSVIEEVRATSEVRATKRTVLVVDDDPMLRASMRRYLERHGFIVHVADDGLEALAALEVLLPALIISDYDMPGMNGLQLLARVRAAPLGRDTPFLLVSGHADSEGLRRRAVAGRANDFLEKPFPLARILDVLS